MEVLRIHLTQTSANYRREEVIENKMTYPLPPISTVIGALHNICGFREYHPMDISIQGDYQSFSKEPYTDYCFLNNTQDDRGSLIKMANPDLLSTGYTVVAKALKSQGNSFRNGTTISVENPELMKEYRELDKIKNRIKEFKEGKYKTILELIKKRKSTLMNKKKLVSKDSKEFAEISFREKEIKQFEKTIKDRMAVFEQENYTKPMSMFRTLTTSLKYYEVLSNIELIIHVKSDYDTLQKIKDHIYEWKSLGRSEDFVEVKEAVFVNIEEPDRSYKSSFHAYIDASIADESEDSNVIIKTYDGNTKIKGVKYYLNKNYDIVNGQRIFIKKKVYYTSNYEVDEESRGVYIDKSYEPPLIVNLI